MASNGSLWWMTPIQALSALSAAFNSGLSRFMFCVLTQLTVQGASGQPCFLSMPMLELPSVPADTAGKQVNFLLERSELVFPRVNALGTVPNLAMSIICFLIRHDNSAAAQKWPFLAGAFACNVGATAWTLIIMAPINNAMRHYSRRLEEDPKDEKSEKLFREAQAKWRKYAVGRAMIMMLSAISGAYTLYLDGKYM